APRGSAAATAGLRRRRLGGASSSASPSGGSVGGGGSNMLRFYTEDAPRLKISLTVSDVTCFDVCIESLLIRRRERGLVDWRRRGMRCRGREGGLGIWVIGGGGEGRWRWTAAFGCGGDGFEWRFGCGGDGFEWRRWREEGEERGGLG
ncbi:hypothetical protein LINPERHAP1_LOCUS37242, partial [Linum perenne]